MARLLIEPLMIFGQKEAKKAMKLYLIQLVVGASELGYNRPDCAQEGRFG